MYNDLISVLILELCVSVLVPSAGLLGVGVVVGDTDRGEEG